MKRLIFLLVFTLVPIQASAFSYATGGCATGGCAAGEQWLYTNPNEIDTALDALEATDASHTSSISTLTSTFSSYLPLSGGTMSGSSVITLGSGGALVVPTGAQLGPTGSGIVLATQMSSSGQIDDNDLAASAVDGGTGGEIQDETITGADILNDTVSLITDTAGNFIQTIAGDSEITVSGSGTEGRDVTLAIASSIARDSEITSAVAAVSAASSTNTAVPRFSGTSGDLQDSGVLIDGSNNVTIPGDITTGTSGTTCLMMTETDATYSECHLVAGASAITCTADADGVCDGT